MSFGRFGSDNLITLTDQSKTEEVERRGLRREAGRQWRTPAHPRLQGSGAELNKLSQLCADAFQIPEEHLLFTFKCKTPHGNIDRVAASVEAHQAFLPSRDDCFFLKFTPCLLLVQSYPGAADG